MRSIMMRLSAVSAIPAWARYHGVEGFRELSHARTVFKRHRFFPIGLFYPPYGNLVQRLSLKLFLGTGDPSLRENSAG